MIFLKYKKISQGRFEKKCGLSNGYIAKLRHAPSYDKIQNIISVFPDLNSDWLLTGEGEMLRGAEEPPGAASLVAVGDGNAQVAGDGNQVTVNAGQLVERMTEQITSQQRQIEKLQEQFDRLLTLLEKTSGKNQ